MATTTNSYTLALRSTLRGAGQVMFQCNSWTGLLFLAGIFWGSYASGAPQVAWGAVVGLVVSTLAGFLAPDNPEDGKEGLWGFNGILVGCAFPTFLDNNWMMWVCLIICAATTPWVRNGFNNVMAPWKVNSLTFPFVFMTWMFLFCARMFKGLDPVGLTPPELELHSVATLDTSFIKLVEYWLKGIAQVFLIDSWVTGIFFLAALAVSSVTSALWAAAGSAIGLLIAIIFGADAGSIESGLFGFSAVLTAIALGNTFYKPTLTSAVWCVIGTIVTVFIQAGMDSMMLPYGVPTLTAPFCITTWLFLLPRYKMHFGDNLDRSNWSKSQQANNKMIMGGVKISDMRLTAAHYKVLAISSAEQIIGAALSTLVGIIIPMIELVGKPHLSAIMQGVLAAAGLTGISLGSAIIGKLSDNKGYSGFFRLCPVIITIGALAAWYFPNLPVLTLSLFIIGIGVGGGYSLDGDYISELMPQKWKLFMVGVAKASSSIGFMGAALLAWIWLSNGLEGHEWSRLMLILAAMGGITFIFRLGWPDSPRWLLDHGKKDAAEKAAKWFYGQNTEVATLPTNSSPAKSASWGEMFKGKNLIRVIYSGIPWAFEGVGVYGVGVFIPMLVMALGIDHTDAVGLKKIENSVELTTYINCFIIVGFVVGLLLVRRLNHKNMLWQGFAGSAIFLAILLAAYLMKWPIAVSVLAFGLFEVFLNAGPHLITFIIPSEIYPVAVRGAGSGIAAMLGKIGAIVGVFIMPMLLHRGGITLVLITCICIMGAGAIISLIFGKMVEKMKNEN